MNNVQDLIFEYNGILDFVKKQAESGLEEFVKLEERLSSFGENLNTFLFNSLEEIENLKKKLNEQKLETNEIIAKLNEKLETLSGTMTDGDYKLCSNACRKDYALYWDLLEEESKKILITSYFILRKISTTNSDFSTVVLCFCKPYENEITQKILSPFVIEESKAPLAIGDKSKLLYAIEYYQKNKTAYLNFKTMMNCFDTTKPNIGYHRRFHDRLYKNKWDMRKITNKNFIKRSIDYMENYRNKAAHFRVIEENIALQCRTKTREMISYFLSAHPKAK